MTSFQDSPHNPDDGESNNSARLPPTSNNPPVTAVVRYDVACIMRLLNMLASGQPMDISASVVPASSGVPPRTP